MSGSAFLPGFEPEATAPARAVLGAVDANVAEGTTVATVKDLRTRLMEALRRDVDSLSNERYMRECSPDVPDLIRERVADYRRRLEALEEER